MSGIKALYLAIATSTLPYLPCVTLPSRAEYALSISIHMTISHNSYHSRECPLARLDQEVRKHKPRQYLLHCGRLPGQKLGMHITMGDCEFSDGLRRVIGRNQLAKSGSESLPRTPDQDRLGR
jgi:hypothetical protein